MASSDQPNTVLNKLSWVLALTRVGLLAEQLIRAFWPTWSIIFVVAAALMMGLQDSLSVEMVWVLGLAALVSTLWFTWRGTRRVKWPTRDQALIRLDETLPGRPLRSLTDTPAMGKQDAATQAIWRAHQSRMAAAAQDARPPKPDLRVARLDPFGLRFVAVLFLAVSLIFGSVSRMESVTAMAPAGAAPTIAVASWEGWIEPPRYTSLPTIYLNDQPQGVLLVPENSRVILRLYGEVGALTVFESVSTRVEDIPSAADSEQEFLLKSDGEIRIDGPGGSSWQVSLIKDQPPVLSNVGPATTSGRGEFSLPFTAQDDYEIVDGSAILSLDMTSVSRQHGLTVQPETRDAIEMALPLPISGDRSNFEETLIEDFSDHVWAHLPVIVTLRAVDAAGQDSAAVSISIPLPARRFFDPLANALVEQRRDLLWSRENARRVGQILRAVSHKPDESLFTKETDYLRLRMILRRLERQTESGLSIEARDEIAQDLWELALAIEEGDLSDALARMERAQERLAEAMKNGASDEEIAHLMQELREATQDYLRQLAQQSPPNGQSDQQRQQAENSMELTQDDLQRMMDRIQELMEQGRMAEAQQALRELQELLENMQVAQGGEGQQSAGEQALDELGETLREQQGLSDQAFRQLQEQFNPGAQAGQSQQNEGFSGGQGRGESHEGSEGQGQGQGEGQSQGRPGSDGQDGQTGQSLGDDLAGRQQALRNELNRQMQNLPGVGSPEGDAARESLGRAGEAMDGAEQALRNDDLAEAIDQQAEAMEALREGMRNLGDALAQNQQNGGQEGQAENQAGQAQDPLGRAPGNQGLAGTDEGLLQGEDVYRRARDLLDEIRKRSGDTSRPEQERNYLRRLLDRF